MTDISFFHSLGILGDEDRLSLAEGASDCCDRSDDLNRVCSSTSYSSTLFTKSFVSGGVIKPELATAGLVVNRELKPISNPSYTG